MRIYSLLMLLALASAGCSSDRPAEKEHRAEDAELEAKARLSSQQSREKSALNVYDADARASCETEIRNKTRKQFPATIVAEKTSVQWDPAYLTGERSRTKQQYPASEAFIVNMLAEQSLAGNKSRTKFTCQVVCLNKGYCNTVRLN